MTSAEFQALRKKANIAQHGLGYTCWEGQLERFAKLVRNAALEQARQTAEDCDVVEVKGSTYYAQLGDAPATQRAIVAAIESLKEPTP